MRSVSLVVGCCVSQPALWGIPPAQCWRLALYKQRRQCLTVSSALFSAFIVELYSNVKGIFDARLHLYVALTVKYGWPHIVSACMVLCVKPHDIFGSS
jgi:hypothetical protein